MLTFFKDVTNNYHIVDILDVNADDLVTYFIQDAAIVLPRKNPSETFGFRRSSINKTSIVLVGKVLESKIYCFLSNFPR